MKKTIFTTFIALLSAATVTWLQIPQLNQIKGIEENALPADLQRDIEAEKVRLNLLQKMPVFGFDNLLADWVFLNFLQYFGDEQARAETGYQLSPDYFEVILKRDPRFLKGYFFLSSSTSLYAGMAEKSVAIMEKGLKLLSPKNPSKSYYIWRYKGVDELLFLGNHEAAKKSFETASEWANTYTDAESQQVAAISHQTAQFLSHNPKSKLAQVSAWSMVLNNALDNRTRQTAIARIEALGGKVIITPEGTVKIQLPESD
ncbi:MAG TPA: hypothetical protein DEG17_13415 [Cyanobacteria bacterium UBA11149]|nr:hypothetical protein [Cyanobacteria bacterium UBA11367]HBE59592.1 hypothetical protein [Cyanobacteria bacterium UBA11366]HBK66306.1 hypothetical protein [Cyanobacteria bacterium UBA11166]HBR75951.1 hypothetical protein [Cyanobacteria bacterium UBA11159]HBS68035.1 hypothetical protein [Cyanobacteria bacterium UBA11153]HBW89840.1 hypothetical protein [Cyanobacteria bacterium UBA11149]HCA98134.1 hypothetical protein [Cyanobacteria bacterium UBA9226]